MSVTAYGRCDGEAGEENIAELPAPLDSALLFGDVILVGRREKAARDLRADDWATISSSLLGGSIELVSESESDDELDAVPEEQKTESGYLKDGFVVDDDQEDDEPYEPWSPRN